VAQEFDILVRGGGHGSWYNAFRRPDFLEWLFEAKN